jgi:K+-sensing histidine kinase KdpD
MTPRARERLAPDKGPPASPGPPATRPDFSVAGLVGAELSAALHTLHRVLGSLGEDGRLSNEQTTELARALDQADQIARQSQQLARLSEGRVRQSLERVSLDQMVETALRDRRQILGEQCIVLTQSIRPVEIVVDPGLLFNLVETALDWAMHRGRHIAVTLEVKERPEHGLLSITASPGSAEQEPQSESPTAVPTLR